jgi:gamma-butyrobetaine dioxygenase
MNSPTFMVDNSSPDSSAQKIVGARIEDDSIVVQWADGHRSNFHHIWLRHNCRCPQCRDDDTDQNMNLIEAIPPTVLPSRLASTSNNLEVTWAYDQHDSTFPAKWLRTHCYSNEERQNRDFKPTLIDADFIESIPRFNYNWYLDEDGGLLEVMQAVNQFGIALVTAAPQNSDTIVKLARRFGPIRETNYGTINDMKVHKDKIVISYTDVALTAHCDEPYCYEPLGVGFFHCMHSAIGEGGTSIFVDCFKIAEDLRKDDKEAFDLLTTVPVQFMRDHIGEQEYRAEGTLIAIDYYGNLNGVRYAERPLAPLDIPSDLVIPYYRAFAEFTRRARDPRNELRFKMDTGDVVIFDNQRMTHGRTAFSGRRHLRTAYVERDFFHSNLRLLSRKSGNPITGRLPGGARR